MNNISLKLFRVQWILNKGSSKEESNEESNDEESNRVEEIPFFFLGELINKSNLRELISRDLVFIISVAFHMISVL